MPICGGISLSSSPVAMRKRADAKGVRAKARAEALERDRGQGRAWRGD